MDAEAIKRRGKDIANRLWQERDAALKRADAAEAALAQMREALADMKEAADLVCADAGITVTWPGSVLAALASTASGAVAAVVAAAREWARDDSPVENAERDHWALIDAVRALDGEACQRDGGCRHVPCLAVYAGEEIIRLEDEIAAEREKRVAAEQELERVRADLEAQMGNCQYCYASDAIAKREAEKRLAAEERAKGMEERLKELMDAT